jgi:hypothetical protein
VRYAIAIKGDEVSDTICTRSTVVAGLRCDARRSLEIALRRSGEILSRR